MNRLRLYSIELLLIVLLMAAVGFFAYLGSGLMQSANSAQEFSGRRAREQAARQLEFGPRITGTENSQRAGDWLAQELVRLNWDVLIEPFTLAEGVEARNVIATRTGPTTGAPVVGPVRVAITLRASTPSASVNGSISTSQLRRTSSCASQSPARWLFSVPVMRGPNSSWRAACSRARRPENSCAELADCISPDPR